jgi:hypothetical protein
MAAEDRNAHPVPCEAGAEDDEDTDDDPFPDADEAGSVFARIVAVLEASGIKIPTKSKNKYIEFTSHNIYLLMKHCVKSVHTAAEKADVALLCGMLSCVS